MARLSFRLSPEQLNSCVCRPCDVQEPVALVSSVFAPSAKIPLVDVQTLRPRSRTATSSNNNLSFKFGTPQRWQNTSGPLPHGRNEDSCIEEDQLWAVPIREGESRLQTLCLDVMWAAPAERDQP